MGDLIQTTPLIQGLRKKYPHSKITLMVSSDFENAISLIPFVDDYIIFNLRQFKESEDWDDVSWVKIYRYIESKLNDIRGKSYDLVVNLSHSRLSALMVHYLKVRNVIGFHSKNYKLEVPTSGLKGLDAVTDILIDEYNETENFIKEIFNQNKREWL